MARFGSQAARHSGQTRFLQQPPGRSSAPRRSPFAARDGATRVTENLRPSAQIDAPPIRHVSRDTSPDGSIGTRRLSHASRPALFADQYGDDAEFGRRMPRCSGRRGGWLLPLWGVPGRRRGGSRGRGRCRADDRHPGRLVAMDSRAWAFPDGFARLIRLRDRVCLTPWCDAPVRHVDHVQAHQDGGPPTRPTGKACASPATTPNKRPAGPPGSDQDDETRWRPPPLPATVTDPEPLQPGQQHLHWPRQARPRVRRPPAVRRLSGAGVGGRG